MLHKRPAASSTDYLVLKTMIPLLSHSGKKQKLQRPLEKQSQSGNGELVHLVGAALAENLRSVPSTHTVTLQLAVTPAPADLMPSSGFQGHCMHVVYTRAYRQTFIHMKQKSIFKKKICYSYKFQWKQFVSFNHKLRFFWLREVS